MNNRTSHVTSTANEVWRTLPQGQTIAGASIGIICIPGVSGLIPGNVQNATSFDFPVMYEVMEDVEFPQIAVGDPVVIPRVIAAARALVKQGAHAVVGACGSLGHYQKPVADAIREPVYMSILTQVPFILQSLGSNQKLLLVFATLGAFTDMVKDQCGIEDTDRLLAIDLVDCEEFQKLSQPNFESDPYIIQRGQNQRAKVSGSCSYRVICLPYQPG